MEFGSKEWMERVGENYSFPAVIAFYTSNQDGSIKSVSLPQDDNKEFKVQSPVYLSSGEILAHVGTQRIESTEEYLEVVKSKREDWKRSSLESSDLSNIVKNLTENNDHLFNNFHKIIQQARDKFVYSEDADSFSSEDVIDFIDGAFIEGSAGE